MPTQPQEQSTLNVKLVHFTKQRSPDEPVQVAFAVTDDQGKEEIITGEVPYSYDIFHLFQEAGWLKIGRACCLDSRESPAASRHVGIVSSMLLEPQDGRGSGLFLPDYGSVPAPRISLPSLCATAG